MLAEQRRQRVVLVHVLWVRVRTCATHALLGDADHSPPQHVVNDLGGNVASIFLFVFCFFCFFWFCRYYGPEMLSRFTSLPNIRTTSPADTGPRLNYVVYVPPVEHMPLGLRRADGTPAEWNAFLAPNWGGVVVQNLPTINAAGAEAAAREDALAAAAVGGGNGSSTSGSSSSDGSGGSGGVPTLKVDLEAAFEAFVWQFRSHVGLTVLGYSGGGPVALNRIDSWEEHRFMRRQLQVRRCDELLLAVF
jgi:hypothetical protein